MDNNATVYGTLGAYVTMASFQVILYIICSRQEKINKKTKARYSLQKNSMSITSIQLESPRSFYNAK